MNNTYYKSKVCIFALMVFGTGLNPFQANCQVTDRNRELMRQYEQRAKQKKTQQSNRTQQTNRQDQGREEEDNNSGNNIPGVKDLGPMSTQAFEKTCVDFISQRDASISAESDVRIIKSCRQEGNKLIASFYTETPINKLTEWNSDLQAYADVQRDRQEKEKEWRKIKNTQQMYRDMIAALEKELAANGIDVVDKGLGLVVKNVEYDGPGGEELKKVLEYAKDNAIQEAKKKYGVANRKPIENKTAEFFEGVISICEDGLSFVPGGDKVTNHYLWRLFSNSPDLGRMLGNGAACIKIYARIDELRKELETLNERERLLSLSLNN